MTTSPSDQSDITDLLTRAGIEFEVVFDGPSFRCPVHAETSLAA